MTQYHPESCDCIVEVESNTYLKRCNLHVRSATVKICYAHNLSFTNRQTDRDDNFVRAKTERERIRRL